VWERAANLVSVGFPPAGTSWVSHRDRFQVLVEVSETACVFLSAVFIKVSVVRLSMEKKCVTRRRSAVGLTLPRPVIQLRVLGRTKAQQRRTGSSNNKKQKGGHRGNKLQQMMSSKL